MAQITSAGLGSGLDINGLVTQLVTAEAEPAVLRLNKREIGLQTQLSAIGTLKGALSGFQDSLNALAGMRLSHGRSTSSSDSSIVTASATGQAALASYSVTVANLAQAHAIASPSFADPATIVGTGTLTISFGDFDGSTFSLNAERGTHSISIDSNHNTLSGVRDAINDAAVGVSASIVNDGSGYRLALISERTGEENSIRVTVADSSDASDLDDAGLSQLAYDPAATAGNGRNLSQTQAALDASLSINGISISSASNTLSDVVDGLTLTLKGSSATAVNVNVNRDSGDARGLIEAFVDEYNSLTETLDTLTGYNADTREAGVLLGDASVRGLRSRIRLLISNVLPGSGGTYNNLASIGITTDSSGKLSVNAAKLGAALEDNYSDVARLFADAGVASDSGIAYVSSGDNTVSGNYAIDISALASRGVYQAAALSSLIVADGSNTLALTIDGIATSTLSLGAQTYASGDALAAELQSRINGDNALVQAGISVLVNYVTDHLEITSSRYGSASTVDISSNTTAGLGISVASGTAGEDVAGSIGGFSAGGSGRTLTGEAGPVQGLALEVSAGVVGDRGGLVFSRGLASQLNTLLDEYLKGDGLLGVRENSLQSRIGEIDEQRGVLDRRLQALELRYRRQFAALDTLVAQLRSTSDFLTQQLANLPGARKSG